MNLTYVGFIVIVAYCITLINFDCLITWWLTWLNRSNNSIFEHGTEISSSVWCHMYSGNRVCTFQNLCYRAKENQFLFLLSEKSTVMGLNSKDDLKSIKLSSVFNHNAFFMNVVVIGQNMSKFKVESLSSKPLFLLWRFKWDNIMHVFHDDILPLFMTYMHLCKNVNSCFLKYTLGFVDKGEEGPFIELYKIFSEQQPILLHKHRDDVCFREVQAGVLSDTIWFQYGFGQPHGPLTSNLSISVLQTFRKYIISKFNMSPKEQINSTIVLLNRNINRRILNKDCVSLVLMNTMQDVYPSSKPHVLEVDLSTHSITYLLEVMATHNIVVGMHGSAMILCLFLRPGSVVVEMFPFGIEPNNVSFLKAFSNIKGTGLIYRSWINANESNSVPHPDAPALLGGIHHLPHEMQKLIVDTKKVPAVECCHNPMYLYRMFQDTIVDFDIKTYFLDALLEQFQSQNSVRSEYYDNVLVSWYYPSQVEEVSCFIKKLSLTVNWQPPFNAINPLTYDVVLLFENNDIYETNTPECFLQINVDFEIQSAKVWIKALSHHGEGVDVYSSCQKIM